MNMTTMAISAYKEALKLNPRMADAHINLGRIYADSGNLSQAQKSFLEVLKIDPASKKAQMLLESVQVSLKASKKTESPFGRLVDIEELDRRLVNSAPRGLSVGQRQQEREGEEREFGLHGEREGRAAGAGPGGLPRSAASRMNFTRASTCSSRSTEPRGGIRFSA